MKKGLLQAVLALTFVAYLTACSSIITVPGGCGSGHRKSTCLGEMTIPGGQVDTFNQASQQAIDAIYSEDLIQDLRAFIETHVQNGSHVKAWIDIEASSAVTMLRGEIDGTQIATYGGVWGWITHLFAGNIAKDGVTNGPILFNRWGLPRTSESIAGTIAHEISHRSRMKHPHSKRSLDVAQCEPPYVIGSLVEKTIVGKSWKPSKNDCYLFE